MTEYTLVIGTKNWSSWSLRPWLLMRAANLAFDEIEIPLRSDETKAAILAHSPSGQVPALKIAGGPVIWESLAICEALAERHPALALWPADAEARARARSVSAEMHSGFRALRMQMPMDIVARRNDVEPSPDTLQDIQRILAIWEDCRARAQDGPFLFGRFSIADAMYAPVVSRFLTYGVTMPAASRGYADAIWTLPAMEAWRAACAAWAAGRSHSSL